MLISRSSRIRAPSSVSSDPPDKAGIFLCKCLRQHQFYIVTSNYLALRLYIPLELCAWEPPLQFTRACQSIVTRTATTTRAPIQDRRGQQILKLHDPEIDVAAIHNLLRAINLLHHRVPPENPGQANPRPAGKRKVGGTSWAMELPISSAPMPSPYNPSVISRCYNLGFAHNNSEATYCQRKLEQERELNVSVVLRCFTILLSSGAYS